MDLDDDELKATREYLGVDSKKEDKIYKYLQENPVHKFALENEIYAIIDHNFPEVKNCVYVNGYISLDVIEKNIKKQEKIDKLKK